MSYITKFSYICLLLALSVLLILSAYPSYFFHLQADIFVFYHRANFFIENLNLADLAGNEYQPGALLFFIILSPVLILSNSPMTFLLGLFIANIFLVFLNAFIYSRYAKTENVIIFSAILLLIGPIIFYRFDLLVATLVNLAILSWKKRHEFISGFLLGIGTQVKVYPVIFLPYLLILSYRKNGFPAAVKIFYAYLLGLLSFLFIFATLFKYSLSNLFKSLEFHTLKSVGLESHWATLITLFNLFEKGALPKIELSYGILAISRKDIIGPLWFYNYFWIIPFILVHFWFFLKSKNMKSYLDIRFFLVNTLLFLIFSKVIAPQYLLWFALLIPMIEFKKVYKKRWIVNFIIFLLICILYQILYPLNYSAWLKDFNMNNTSSYLLLINTLRNILLTVLLISLAKDLIGKPNNT